MAQDIQLTVEVSAMQKSFSILSRSAQGFALRVAADAGAGVLKKAMAATSPKLSGATKRSITVKRVKISGSGKGNQKRVIGPSYKLFMLRKTKAGKLRVATKKTMDQAKKRHVPGNVAHLVEGGHGGPQPAPAHPWMEPAFKASARAAEQKAVAKLMEMINKGADRAAAKSR